MNEIQIPPLLNGPWDHAVFVTYGVDIPFFEGTLWRELRKRCRNRIILADSQRFLDSCSGYAHSSGLIRSLNHQYIGTGIFVPQSAHAKLILLVGSEQGRLLVGSGNLSWSGYASGGELFSQYEYGPENKRDFNAFATVDDWLNALIQQNYIYGQAAIQRLSYMREKTPWLYQERTATASPVRHNLEHSFLDQIVDAVGDGDVEEMWLHAPFYDEQGIALQRLLLALNPQRANILLQKSYTSVSPELLQGLSETVSTELHFYSVQRPIDEKFPYLHAKFYLIKLSNRAICLYGSPNLSQVALLLTPPRGNLEMANLLFGNRNEFDSILAPLVMEEVTRSDLPVLEIAFYSNSEVDTPADLSWYLTDGEWESDKLWLRFKGEVPRDKKFCLQIGDTVLSTLVAEVRLSRFEFTIEQQTAELLQRPAPVRVCWRVDDQKHESNPVYIFNRSALTQQLEVVEGDDSFNSVGELDLDDDELEQLLLDLDSSLVLDRASLWRLAGHSQSQARRNDDVDDDRFIDYDDIDYEMLRNHPRLQQYLLSRGSSRQSMTTRLQALLNQISRHFQSVRDLAKGEQLVAEIEDAMKSTEVENEEEAEQQAEQRKHQKWSADRRRRRLLMNFIDRYLQGIQEPKFQELVGHEVLIQNNIIFIHILWRLLSKEWIEVDYIIRSSLTLWGFLWGDEDDTGYFHQLDPKHQAESIEWLYEGNVDVQVLTGLYFSSEITLHEHLWDLRIDLRNFARRFFANCPFDYGTERLHEIAEILKGLIPYESPLPTNIVDSLYELCKFDTDANFLRTLEQTYGFRNRGCRFEKVTVMRPSIGQSQQVKCLTIHSRRQLDQQILLDILKQWQLYDQPLDYYRIAVVTGGKISDRLFYDEREESGFGLIHGQELELSPALTSSQRPIWQKRLITLEEVARVATAEYQVDMLNLSVLSKS